MPTPAELPDGLGTTFTGSLLVVLKPPAEGFGEGFAVAFGLALVVVLGVT